ncbi:hypothetical protein ACXR2U_10370 [Jatrophihabitans sp. YIM 134969]
MPSRHTGLLVAAVVAAGLAAVTPPAAAAPGPAAASPWTLVTPTVPTAPNGDVEAVGCAPDGTVCTEVGSYHDPSGRQRALIAQRRGSTWRPITVTTPDGAVTIELAGVSCATATACTAVGRWSPTGAGGGFDPADDRPLAYVWNGSTWRRSDLALPSGRATGRLSAVSCATATSCLAVGDTEASDGSRASLAYAYGAAGWRSVPVPVVTPSDHTYEGLEAVSCAAATTCVATGQGADAAGLILGWDGTNWKRQHAPAVPESAGISELSGVACPTTTTCTAVGYYYDLDSGKDVPRALRSSGAAWTADTPPGVRALGEVSCPTTASCTATTTRTSGGVPVPAVARRNAAGTWSVTTLPEPTPVADYGALTGISCTGAKACTAVGNGGGVPFVERFTGTWTVEPTVAPAGVFGSRLGAVSCSAASACTAVGTFRTAGATRALVERWDGTTWTRQPVPARNTAPLTDLLDVACPSASTCWAVGADGDDPDGVSGVRPLLLRWEGGTWTTVPAPGPAVEGQLTSVSCTSVTSCVAVGWRFGTGGSLSYVLRGTTWTAEPVPTPAGVVGLSLTGVSCVATTCHAVGNGPQDGGGIAHVDLVWNGTTWKSGPAVPGVDAVSCATTTRCTAVGRADPGAQAVVVASLRGGVWRRESVPTPGGTAFLAGVSCVAATCTAVGTADKALVARSVTPGTWTLEAAVTPSGAGGLSDVACTDATSCVAVGTFGGRGVLEVRAG